MAVRLIDDNAVIDFIDDNAITDFVDDIGQVTFDDGGETPTSTAILLPQACL